MTLPPSMHTVDAAVKRLIVWAYCRGLLTVAAAEWLSTRLRRHGRFAST